MYNTRRREHISIQKKKFVACEPLGISTKKSVQYTLWVQAESNILKYLHKMYTPLTELTQNVCVYRILYIKCERMFGMSMYGVPYLFFGITGRYIMGLCVVCAG